MPGSDPDRATARAVGVCATRAGRPATASRAGTSARRRARAAAPVPATRLPGGWPQGPEPGRPGRRIAGSPGHCPRAPGHRSPAMARGRGRTLPVGPARAGSPQSRSVAGALTRARSAARPGFLAARGWPGPGGVRPADLRSGRCLPAMWQQQQFAPRVCAPDRPRAGVARGVREMWCKAPDCGKTPTLGRARAAESCGLAAWSRPALSPRADSTRSGFRPDRGERPVARPGGSRRGR